MIQYDMVVAMMVLTIVEKKWGRRRGGREGENGKTGGGSQGKASGVRQPQGLETSRK